MSSSDLIGNTSQPITGQLFGLFGCTDDCADDQVVANDSDNQLVVEKLAANSDQQDNETIETIGCIVCRSGDTKYCCPKCHSKTCSLICCKTHKMKFNCNGLRVKTSFVQINQFTQQDFLSDYFFLEDVDKTLDNSGRQRRAIVNSKYILPKWLQKLVREARLRGTNLKIMPGGFARRKQNTSCFMYNQNTINWDIELKFVHALDDKQEVTNNLDQLLADDLVVSHSEYSRMNHRVCENTPLNQLIAKYLESSDLVQDFQQNHKLMLYQKTGITGISILFRDESVSSKDRKYFDLDLNKTIKDLLNRKTVIEFPTFVVILNEFKHLFDIKD